MQSLPGLRSLCTPAVPVGAAGLNNHTPQVMVSVALDIFHLPTVRWEGEEYDMMCVCVDRMSGWIVAIPGKIKGLTGAKVAKEMLKHQWRPFGYRP